MKTSLENAGEELASTKAELEAAAAALARSRDVASAEAEALRAEAQPELENVVAEKHALEEWRAEREAWEEQTKSNFLDVEAELAAAKAALAAAESGSEDAVELAARLAESESALEAAREAGGGGRRRRKKPRPPSPRRGPSTSACSRRRRLDPRRPRRKRLWRRLWRTPPPRFAKPWRRWRSPSRTRARPSRPALGREDARGVRRGELKAAHQAQIWEMETNMRALEDTMERTRDIARENAERMLRHNERMGRVVANAGYDEADIPREV